MPSSALNQYRYAAELAQDANHAAEDGRKVFDKYKYQRERLIEWDRTIAPQRATFIAFTILFPIIAVVEYLFSEELYRDVLPNWPWAMGLIFAVLAVIIAELIVYRCFDVKRQWKANELKRSEKWKNQPDQVINRKVQSITKRQLAVGIVLLTIMVVILGYMSWDRVQRMRAAGLSVSAFGPIDILPVLLYLFEVVTGMFIWYGILRLDLGLTVRSAKKKFDLAVRRCSELTINAVQAFNKAEDLGYDIFKNPVTKSIQEAFCRNDSLTEANGIEYLSEQQIGIFSIKLNLKQHGTTSPVVGNIQVATDYKFSSASGTQNGELLVSLESFLRSRAEPGNRTEDSIRKIHAEYQRDGQIISKTVTVAIDMDLEGPHTVFI